jgi:anti-anti-sigma factor
MATPLRLETGRRDDGSLVLSAAGELDLSNIAAFTDALASTLAQLTDGHYVVVDLTNVDYLDSGAINVLYDHAEGISLVANPVLMPVLKASGLTDVLDVELPGPA